MAKERSAFIRAIARDNSLPVEQEAVDLWLQDLNNPSRWILRPLLQFVFGAVLHVVWFFKRLPLPQFRAHGALQWLICWFSLNFVSHEANLLILRHFATESNILNFLAENSGKSGPEPVSLYPKRIEDMKQASFVRHDQELFRLFEELGYWTHRREPLAESAIRWKHWQPIRNADFDVPRKWSQVLDFESAHALFMCLFCLLLTRDEYRDAINGFNLDQSMAIRIGQLLGEPGLPEMAFNKYPLYPVGPWNLSQRFLMHGFFTEHLYARLEAHRKATAAATPSP